MDNQEYQYYFYKHTILFKYVLKDILDFDIQSLYNNNINITYNDIARYEYNQDVWDRYGSECDNDDNYDEYNNKLYGHTDDWEEYYSSIYD
jgi:hypothetical protein